MTRNAFDLSRSDGTKDAKQILRQSAVPEDTKLHRDVPAPNVAAGTVAHFADGYASLALRPTDMARNVPTHEFGFWGPPAEAGLLTLNAHPAPFESVLALPAGNREAQTASVPAATNLTPSGDTFPASASSAPDGFDAAAAVGAGPRASTISTAGSFLGPPADPIIYAVSAPSLVEKRFQVVVEAGPSGGGGLDAYGILRCDQIFTVDLTMPAEPWILEYCDPESSAGDLRAPHAEKRFDFKRPGPPPETSGSMIVLHGWIQADGTVEVKEIVRGAEPAADAFAEHAFSQWKFAAATRGGSPVRVEVLVGIPANGNP